MCGPPELAPQNHRATIVPYLFIGFVGFIEFIGAYSVYGFRV